MDTKKQTVDFAMKLVLGLNLLLLVSAQAESRLIFHCSFDQSLNADYAEGSGEASRVGVVRTENGRGWSGEAADIGASDPKRPVHLRYSSADNINPAAGTIEMWVNLDFSPAQNQNIHCFIDCKSRDNRNFLRLRTGESRWLYLTMKADGIWQKPIGADIGSWERGQWHHVAVTWDHGQYSLSIDGEWRGAVNGKNLAPISLDDDIHLGTDCAGDYPVNALIDEFKIRDSAPEKSLPPQELAGEKRIRPANGTNERAISQNRLVLRTNDVAPEIDGRIDKAEWYLAAAVAGSVYEPCNVDAQSPGRFWLQRDDLNLYAAFEVPLSRGQLQTANGSDAKLKEDHLFELLLAPSSDKTYRLRVNGHGGITDASIADGKSNSDWDCNAEVATAFADGIFCGELKVPFKNLEPSLIKGEYRLQKGIYGGVAPPRLTDDEWKLNFAFLSPAFQDRVCWASEYISESNAAMGELVFLKSAPAVHADASLDGTVLKGSLQANQVRVNDELEFRVSGSRNGDLLLQDIEYFKSRVHINSQKFAFSVNLLQDPIDYCEMTIASKKYDTTYFRWQVPVPQASPKPARYHYSALDQELIVYLDLKTLSLLVDMCSATVAIVPESGENAVLRKRVVSPEINFLELDVSALVAGKYDIAVEYLTPAGDVVHAEMLSFIKSDWNWKKAAALGRSEEPVPPWTALQNSDSRISLWGRTYSFDGAGLLSSITSQGLELLYAPVILKYAANGSVNEFRSGPVRVLKSGKAQMILEKYLTSEDLQATARFTVEYDGVIKVELILKPQHRPVNVEHLSLSIPCCKEIARFYHYFQYPDDVMQGIATVGYGNKSGALPDGHGQIWQSAFEPFVWLGNERMGLLWFADSARNFQNLKRDEVLAVTRTESSIRFEVNFIDRETLIEDEIDYVFGLQATPVRPLPEKWQTWRFFNPKWIRGFRKVYGSRSDEWTDLGVEWHNNYTSHIGWPFPDYPEIYKMVHQQYKQEGIKNIPYIVSSGFDLRLPESARHLTEFGLRPPGTEEWAQQSGMKFYCMNSRWADMWVWFVHELIEKYDIDGIYLDNMDPLPCTNNTHDCGYRYKEDYGIYFGGETKIAPHYPLFRTRDTVKRIRTIFAQHGKEPIIITSSRGKFPLYAFADMAILGEQIYYDINRDKKHYTNCLSPESWLVEFNPFNYGNIPVMLPEFRDARGQEESATRDLLTITLLHGGEVWASVFCEPWPIFQVWEAKSSINIGEAEFIPYWRSADLVKTDSESVKVSLYRGPDLAMLIAGNLSGMAQKATLELNAERWGQNAESAVIDAFTHDEIPLETNRIELQIEANNFKLVFLKGMYLHEQARVQK